MGEGIQARQKARMPLDQPAGTKFGEASFLLRG